MPIFDEPAVVRAIRADQAGETTFQRELDKESERIRAAQDVGQFESYVDLLVSVHKKRGRAWDWHLLANSVPPSVPSRESHHESAANDVLHTYKPGFLDRVFRLEKKRVSKLEQAVVQARAIDQAEHEEALREYEAAHKTWNQGKSLATRILAAEASAYEEALNITGALKDISSFQTRVTVRAAQPELISIACEVTDDELVPTENHTRQHLVLPRQCLSCAWRTQEGDEALCGRDQAASQ